MAKHLRPADPARRAARAVTVPAVALAALSLAAPAMAAKPGGSTATGGTTSASCSASPNPVAQNSDYTLTVNGLAAAQIVNVMVSDSAGTTVWQLQADGSGVITVVGHAYWTGTSKVTVQKQAKRTWSTVTTCSFTVV
jgi:hypothetical protein